MQSLAKVFVTLDDEMGDPPARDAERCALAADSLRASGRLRLQVRGESMLPILWPGDLVEIRSCSVDDVLPGEIVLAVREDRFFLHRFVGRLQTNGFLLRGDSMPRPDPKFPNDALLGRLVSCARQCQRDNEGPVRPVLPLRPWSWAIGQFICFFGPARRLALKLYDHQKRNARKVQSAEFGADPAANNLGMISLGAADAGVS